jgi:hypothetical protein
VEDLLLQPFIDLVGDGIGRLQEMDISSPVSGGYFPIHEEFSPRSKRRLEAEFLNRPVKFMDSQQGIHVSMYPRKLILNPQKIVKGKSGLLAM